ncbi:MAG: hypothetical protein ACRD0W_14855 [Acidimicrobiales bacterium]
MSHWAQWHVDYDNPGSALARRLRVVQALLGRALDTAPPGPVRLLSLCAGQARDVLGVVPGHPRRNDVRARLVELDPDNAAAAREGIRRAGLDQIDVLAADAGTTDSAVGAVPADVVLLCGVFGNITDDDIEGTIRATPMLCASGATSCGPGTGGRPTSCLKSFAGSRRPASWRSSSSCPPAACRRSAPIGCRHRRRPSSPEGICSRSFVDERHGT